MARARVAENMCQITRNTSPRSTPLLAAGCLVRRRSHKTHLCDPKHLTLCCSDRRWSQCHLTDDRSLCLSQQKLLRCGVCCFHCGIPWPSGRSCSLSSTVCTVLTSELFPYCKESHKHICTEMCHWPTSVIALLQRTMTDLWRFSFNTFCCKMLYFQTSVGSAVSRVHSPVDWGRPLIIGVRWNSCALCFFLPVVSCPSSKHVFLRALALLPYWNWSLPARIRECRENCSYGSLEKQQCAMYRTD